MKTILCPVDFSISSDHVSKYAAQLACDTHSKVVLVGAHLKSEKVISSDWINYGEVMDRLGELHDMLTELYHIPVGSEAEPISDNPYVKLGTLADHHDMMILGVRPNSEIEFTNSTGFDLIKIIHQCIAPLLIVPEKYEYKTVERLLYAYDYKHESEPPLVQLRWLAKWFGVGVRFISIIESNISKGEEEKVTIAQNRIAAQWKSDRMLDFETIIHDNAAAYLEHRLRLQGEDNLLILSVNHQNMIERIWHKSVVKRLLRNAENPYLILHK